MIRSMTAFARHQEQTDWGRVIWELRSVNHRYLEASVRLPDAFRGLEPKVRDSLGEALHRGKVECTLKFQPAMVTQAGIGLNAALAQQLAELGRQLQTLLDTEDGMRVGDILRWPGVVSEPEPDFEPLHRAMLAALQTALADMVATRQREGERIQALLLQRSDALEEQVRQVRARRPEVVARQREKLLNRINELDLDADPTRLEQELVIIAQRLDVAEELDRLDAHIAELREVLERPDAVGRRLDFLLQEFNREANTLASKSADAETTRASTELKVLIEQLREQIQNVE